MAPTQEKATKHTMNNTFPNPFCIRNLQIHKIQFEICIFSTGCPFKVLRTFQGQLKSPPSLRKMFEKHCPSPHKVWVFFFSNWVFQNLNLCCSGCKNHTDSYTPTSKHWKEQFPVNLKGACPCKICKGPPLGALRLCKP